MIPVLETERLRMRAPTMADFDKVAAFFESERSRFVGGPRGRLDSWRAFAANIGQWALKGHGMWAVEERATGAYIGQIGCWDPEGWIVREVGWIVVDAGQEGRGFAREAASRARAYAYETLGWSEVFSVIDPENARSIALATRLGCTVERTEVLSDGQPVLIWRHPAPEAAR
jgi:RimJ/RimL family protein N-acetyltransferase